MIEHKPHCRVIRGEKPCDCDAQKEPFPIGPEMILTQADMNLCLGSKELLPCPFCGDKWPMSFGEKTPNGRATCWKVQCTQLKRSCPDCCASVWATDRDQDKARADAVRRWNRRPEVKP